jgi:Super-infection exclusion protein B
MESLGKILEFVGKYSWAVFVMVAFIIFVPDDGAKQLSLYDIRTTYKGFLWLALVLTGALWIGAIFSYIDKKLLDGWLESRRTKKSREAKELKQIENIRLRLNSLDDREQLWIKYCLFHNVQSLSAPLDNNTAQSLVNKQILIQGSGSMLSLPFHFPDEVWRLLKDERKTYLTEQESNDPRFKQVLEKFRGSLHPHW